MQGKAKKDELKLNSDKFVWEKGDIVIIKKPDKKKTK